MASVVAKSIDHKEEVEVKFPIALDAVVIATRITLSIRDGILEGRHAVAKNGLTESAVDIGRLRKL